VGLLLAVAGLLAAAPVSGDPPEAPRCVRVSVIAILASDRDDVVDPRLTDIAREVQQNVDGRLTSFAVARMCCKPIPVGSSHTFPLVGNWSALVAVDHCCPKDERICVTVTPPKLGQFTYTAACGKFLPIVTSCRTARGELLILAVRVQSCPGKPLP
jgi:hypothetical protein